MIVALATLMTPIVILTDARSGDCDNVNHEVG